MFIRKRTFITTILYAEIMEPEVWKWIPNYGWYYSVSSYGKIRSRRSGRDICLMKDKDGYLKCCLYKRGKRETFRVHRLVAMAFLTKPEDCDEVNHKDSNRQNNRVENLEWVTRERNLALRYTNRTKEVNVVCAESFKIISMCRSVAEASTITGVLPNVIRKILGTNESVNGYRFEVGF